MWKRTLRIAATVIALLLAWPASAQEWSIPFPPGDALLPPEGYVAAREAVAWAAGEPRSGLTLTAYEIPDEVGSQLSRDRTRGLYLELIKLGLWQGRVRIGPAAADAVPHLVLRAAPSARLGPYIDQMLVFFGVGSADVPEAVGYSLQVYTAQYRPGNHRIAITGRTDTSGSADANQRLSERRAGAVAGFLAAHGVDWADMDIAGKGETQLSRATGDGVTEPLNRLVYVDMRTREPHR
jgi:hypothetical protein